MTAASFPVALAFTLSEEGGWTVDSGGPTWHGETLAAFREFTGNPHATAAQLHALGPAETRAFYASLWARIQGDNLPTGVDLTTFDALVNTGTNAVVQLQRVAGLAGIACDGQMGARTIAAVSAAGAAGLALRLQSGGTKALQAGLGLLQDGQMGPITLAAAKTHRDATMAAALLDQQTTFYRACDLFPKYGKGWLSRAQRRAQAAMRLAVGDGVGLRAPIS